MKFGMQKVIHMDFVCFAIFHVTSLCPKSPHSDAVSLLPHTMCAAPMDRCSEA